MEVMVVMVVMEVMEVMVVMEVMEVMVVVVEDLGNFSITKYFFKHQKCGSPFTLNKVSIL